LPTAKRAIRRTNTRIPARADSRGSQELPTIITPGVK
jgi:hypothetical protein